MPKKWDTEKELIPMWISYAIKKKTIKQLSMEMDGRTTLAIETQLRRIALKDPEEDRQRMDRHIDALVQAMQKLPSRMNERWNANEKTILYWIRKYLKDTMKRSDWTSQEAMIHTGVDCTYMSSILCRGAEEMQNRLQLPDRYPPSSGGFNL